MCMHPVSSVKLTTFCNKKIILFGRIVWPLLSKKWFLLWDNNNFLYSLKFFGLNTKFLLNLINPTFEITIGFMP